MSKGKSPHTKTDARKRDILIASLECFTREGYDGTAIADICERSGASVGSVYHHFGGKEGIAAALYLEGIREYQAGLLDAMEGEAGAEKGIGAIVRYHILWVRDNRDWAVFLFQKRHEEFMSGTEENLNELNKEFVERISRWFSQRVKSGDIKKLGWDMYIAILLGPCQEFARMYLAGKSFSDPETAARDLADSTWRSLAGK